MKTVVVDPRRIGLGSQADVLLQVRPGADGALALALVHVMIEEGRYDEDFVRHWTNGPFLLRADTGEALTEADLTAGGSPDRYVIWDEASERAVVYDPRARACTENGVRPALLGNVSVPARDGAAVSCEPAFAALARLAASHAPERSETVTRVPADKVSGSGPCPRRQPAREHVHVERCRPAHQRDSDEPGDIHPVRGCWGTSMRRAAT